MVRLVRAAQPDAVIHLAARPRVRFTVEQPLASSTANLLGTITVLDSLLRAELIGKTRFVFASSSAVYGTTDVLPTPETHPFDPQSPYALQKCQGEQWCRMFHRLYGLDVVSLRYFNVIGPGAAFGGAYSSVVSAWLYHLCVDPSYRPYLEGDGTQTRDFCSVEDVAWANVRAATRADGFSGQALNVARGPRLLDARRQGGAGGGVRPAARSRAATSGIRWPTSRAHGRSWATAHPPTSALNWRGWRRGSGARTRAAGSPGEAQEARQAHLPRPRRLQQLTVDSAERDGEELTGAELDTDMLLAVGSGSPRA